MSPRYQLGDGMLVNPDVRLRAGDDVLLSRDRGGGTRESIMRRLVKVTRTAWCVPQFTSCHSEALDRRQWPKVELIVGMYRRR